MSFDPDRFASLLEAPSPAVLTTYRRDGSAVASPVWYRYAAEHFDVVIAADDVKLRHLAARPHCSLVVFEAVPPFRGVRIEGEPVVDEGEVTDVRLAIAGRYLGGDRGAAFTAGRGPGVVLRLSAVNARVWDLEAMLPA